MLENLHRHFIRGYFDGDGGINVTISKNRSSTMKITGTLPFVTKISSLIKSELDINMCIYSCLHSPVFDVCTSGNRQLLKIFDWLYRDSRFYLDRKFNKYQDLISKVAKIDELAAVGTQGYSKKYLNK
jgi:hypothetical protein